MGQTTQLARLDIASATHPSPQAIPIEWIGVACFSSRASNRPYLMLLAQAGVNC